MQPSEGYLHTEDHIIRDKSGHGDSVTEQVILTSWRPHWEGQVRTQKKCDRASGTHCLETAF
jgi:hypothetical protein